MNDTITIWTSISYQAVQNFQCVHHRLVTGKCFERHCHRSKLNSWYWQNGLDTGKVSCFWMSFVPGTHFYRQKTKYTQPAAKLVPTTRKNEPSLKFESTSESRRGVGGKPKIVDKRDPSVSNFAWKAFFRWTWTSILLPELGFLNISEYLARCGIQMDPLVNERSWPSGKKPVLCMLGLLSTIIRGRERSDQESVCQEKIALAHEHNWAPITSISACEVDRISARRLGHPARAAFFLDFFSLPPTPRHAGRNTVFNAPWFWKDFQNAMNFQNTKVSFTCAVERSHKSRTSIFSQPIFLSTREILVD